MAARFSTRIAKRSAGHRREGWRDDVPGGNFSSGANAVSADGNVIVGSASGIGDPDGAFVWTRALGMVSLKQYLGHNGIAGLDGWHLTDARGISGDGRTIVGTGVNPQGLLRDGSPLIDLDGPGIGTARDCFALGDNHESGQQPAD